MKNEHFVEEDRKELNKELANKRQEMYGQKHALDNATTSYNDYRDSHTGTVQPICILYTRCDVAYHNSDNPATEP